MLYEVITKSCYMLNKNQHIDRIYKEAFSNMEDATPPSFIWDNINAELSSQRRIKRQLFIWRSSYNFV